ncbi:MAG TPA: addiction module protein [Thermoanaerobaculia bacterium]|jgi:putative addiction module component (TIGR02574 family)|nr:addiction module protein [Thermoanaerobaculia bacterium]
MSKNAARLLQDALQLSENERVELACGLLDSLDPEPPREEARSDQEWLSEIERRTRAALAGELGIPWEEARANIERHLRRE